MGEELHPYYDRPSKAHSEKIAGVALLVLAVLVLVLCILLGVAR